MSCGLQSIVLVPARVPIRGIKSGRGMQDIFVPLFTYPLGEFNTKHRWEAAGTCTFVRGCTFLLYEEHFTFICLSMLRCLQPVLGWPWPAALCPPQQHRKENTMEKLMGQAKDREITKLMYCLAMSSFDTLCQKTHLCHEGNRTNGKNVYMLQPQRFPNDWDCRKLGMNLLCLVKQGPVD